MKKLVKAMCCLMAIIFVVGSIPITAIDVSAQEQSGSSGQEEILYTSNAGENDYGLRRYNFYRKTINSYLITNADGTISRVEYSPRTTKKVPQWNSEKQEWEWIEELVSEEKFIVENYNAQYELLGQIELQRELERYIGFYSGSDYNWFVFGQDNPWESDSVEVYRIVKYTKDWQRVGQSSLCGANTYEAISCGTCRMAEYNGKLFIRTCHAMYTSSDGNHHQANITIQVDENSMEASYTTWGYVSHSFDQFIDFTDGMMTAVDLGDAYPRSVVWFKYPNNMSNVDVINRWSAIQKDILTIASADNSSDAHAYNATGVSVGGYEVTTNNYLVALSSVDQSDSHNQVSDTAVRDVYVVTLSKNDYTRNTNRITEYTEGMAGTPQLVKVATDKYILMWNYRNNDNTSIRYVMIDGDGNALTQIYSWGDGESDASLSDCKPIVIGGKLIWYSTFERCELVFYELDYNNLGAGIKTHKNYTHEYSTDWTYDSEKHWHGCVLSECDGTVIDEGQHIESDWIIDYDANSNREGKRHKECTVCGYITAIEQMKVHYTHKYSTAWTYDSEKHWHKCTLGRCDGTVADEGQHIESDWIIDYNATSYGEGRKHKECTVCGYVITTEKIRKLDDDGNSFDVDGWHREYGVRYWYENGERQGVRYNEDGSIDTSYRGKEIYDPSSDAWYWLDCVQNGAVAKNKDVYQESGAGEWGDSTSGTGEKIGKWVRYDSDGHMIKGWQTTYQGTYYFDPVYGTMAKGDVVIDGQNYYFNKDTGILERSDQTDDDGNSFLTDGWHKVDGVNYWYENGVRQGVRYNADGSIDTSYRGKEIYDPSTDAWYWLDCVQNGAVAKDKDVYQESGAGQWGESTNENGEKVGKWVRYDENGHMVKGWQNTETETYYFDPVYGTMAKGDVVIDGQTYYFDANTGVLQ